MAQSNSKIGGRSILLKRGNGFTGAVTFQNTGDTVTKNGHGLLAGQKVSFSSVVTTTTVAEDTEYFVINPLANTFQLSLTLGGSAVAIDADGTGTAAEVFESISGLRSKSLSINSELVDITSHDSSEWMEKLDQAGVRSASLSGEGVFADQVSFDLVLADTLARKQSNWRLFINDAGDYFQGCFQIASKELAGEYNAEGTYSLSLESSGAIALTRV